MISVFLCDPQPIVHQGLEAALAGSESIELIGVCGSLEDASIQIPKLEPAVALVVRSFGMHQVLEWVARLRRACPDTEVVLWAAAISDVESFRVLQSGARGIVKKTAATETLIECLRAVSEKQLWTESLLLSKESPLGRPRNRPLTPREQQVAALVAKGMKNREIAEALQIATGTVKIHLMHIFEKTGIRDRFELALQGLRLACEKEPEYFDSSAVGSAAETVESDARAPVEIAGSTR